MNLHQLSKNSLEILTVITPYGENSIFQVLSIFLFFEYYLFVCVLFILVFFLEILCSFGLCPGTHSMDQSGLRVTDIRLSLPP